MQHIAGGTGDHVSMGVEDIDTTREPGMTDEQLRAKIVGQFKAKGIDTEVVVEGEKVQIRAQKRIERP